MQIRSILASLALLLAVPLTLCAQDDTERPLGDLARSLRKQPVVSETVIDNDNLSAVMDDAETHRAASPVFSLDPGSKSFHLSSPDVTCSLAFSSKNISPDAYLVDDLPHAELAKLEGPATLDGDTLQVSMHNGTTWVLRELVIGLTIVRRRDPSESAFYSNQARIFPALAGTTDQAPDSSQKQPDVTLLLHVKGSAVPSATAVFRTQLNFALFPDQEWHWAIMRAKGIPPQNSPEPAALLPGKVPMSPPQGLPTVGVEPPMVPSNSATAH